MLNYLEDNEAYAVGCIDSVLTYSHGVHSEGFYNFKIRIDRLSGNADTLLVTASERTLSGLGFEIGRAVLIKGQFRSYNNYGGTGSKLILTLFAREISEMPQGAECENEVYLNGFICKTPVFRVTPFGREIADILLAVNRAYSKSDYIPCIAWGRNARFVKRLSVGQNVRIYGRMQSREYQKRTDDGSTVTKTAYEVSVCKIETAEE